MKTQLSRVYTIRALHNLENPDVSDAENERLYGMCFRTHGHHYKVIVTIESEVDPKTGICKFRTELDSLVQKEIVSAFDGKLLNDTYLNTSGEALVHLFYDRLIPHIPKDVRLKIAIQETRKNYFAGCS